MNVIVVIDGREAIPVRAIPLLTSWEVMSPDSVARALAGAEFPVGFDGLCAHRVAGSLAKQIRALTWKNFTVRKLNAISDEIKAEQVTHEAGYQKWRKQSLVALPAGVFVWKDEYVPLYEGRYGAETLARSLGRKLTEAESQARELDFDPDVDDFEIGSLILEGFELQKAAVATLATPVESNSTAASLLPATGTKEQRQDRRLQACIETGLLMNTRAALLRLPDGVGDIARSQGVTRQAFSTDVKAALKRQETATRQGIATRPA